MGERLLVELYAGLASLSLWCVGAKPVLGRRGSKQAYAGAIAEHLFKKGKPTRFLLNDADAGVANTLSMLIQKESRNEIVTQIEEWASRKKQPYLLWHELKETKRLSNPANEAARWLVVSAGSAQRDFSSGSYFNPSRIPKQGEHPRSKLVPELPVLIERVRSFPFDSSFCEMRCGSAETLKPIPGSVVYLDPPYEGTQGYSQIKLMPPRQLCQNWADMGCVVGLSESDRNEAPLGWSCYDLSAINSRRQMIKVGRKELLFVSR